MLPQQRLHSKGKTLRLHKVCILCSLQVFHVSFSTVSCRLRHLVLMLWRSERYGVLLRQQFSNKICMPLNTVGRHGEFQRHAAFSCDRFCGVVGNGCADFHIFRVTRAWLWCTTPALLGNSMSSPTMDRGFRTLDLYNPGDLLIRILRKQTSCRVFRCILRSTFVFCSQTASDPKRELSP